MQTVAIAGVGLIGGSFGLALRQAGFTGTILGVSSPRTIAAALDCGAIDRAVPLEEAARCADLLLLAQPISGIIATLGRLQALRRADLLITDAGSTKRSIVQAAAGLPLFLGGHPMAGKEARGTEAADANLFAGRPWVLAPPERANNPAVQTFTSWLERIGAVPVWMSPDEHDRTVAFTSHLPQLLSTALASVVGSEPSVRIDVSGPALQDLTRLALSSWEIWSDITVTNQTDIRHALSVYIDKLIKLRDNLGNQRVGEEFAFAAKVARGVRQIG